MAQFNVTTTGINVILDDLGINLSHPETVDLYSDGLGSSDILDSIELQDALDSGVLTATDENGVNITSTTLSTISSSIYKTGSTEESKSVTILKPTSLEEIGLWNTDQNITITKVLSYIKGGLTSVTFNVFHGTNPSSGTSVYISNQVESSKTSVSTRNTDFNNNSIPTGSAIWLDTISTAGGVGDTDSLHLTIYYTID